MRYVPSVHTHLACPRAVGQLPGHVSRAARRRCVDHYLVEACFQFERGAARLIAQLRESVDERLNAGYAR